MIKYIVFTTLIVILASINGCQTHKQKESSDFINVCKYIIEERKSFYEEMSGKVKEMITTLSYIKEGDEIKDIPDSFMLEAERTEFKDEIGYILPFSKVDPVEYQKSSLFFGIICNKDEKIEFLAIGPD